MDRPIIIQFFYVSFQLASQWAVKVGLEWLLERLISAITYFLVGVCIAIMWPPALFYALLRVLWYNLKALKKWWRNR